MQRRIIRAALELVTTATDSGTIVDVTAVRGERQSFDLTGHCSRPDVSVSVDRRRCAAGVDD